MGGSRVRQQEKAVNQRFAPPWDHQETEQPKEGQAGGLNLALEVETWASLATRGQNTLGSTSLLQ